MRIEGDRLHGDRPGDKRGQPGRNGTGTLDAHESRSLVEQFTLGRVGSVHDDEGAPNESRAWESGEMNQRTSRVSHMDERHAICPFPEDASRPIPQPGNVLVGEHFAWPVDEIAEVDGRGLDARYFHQVANGNADMG